MTVYCQSSLKEIIVDIARNTDVSATRCPPNLGSESPIVERGSLCYQFVDVERSWNDARDDCRSKGGFLVEVLDQATQDFLVNSLQSLGWSHHGVWIGGTDHDVEGKWVWDTGEGLDVELCGWCEYGCMMV